LAEKLTKKGQKSEQFMSFYYNDVLIPKNHGALGGDLPSSTPFQGFALYPMGTLGGS
jgi:hypothetical protein